MVRGDTAADLMVDAVLAFAVVIAAGLAATDYGSTSNFDGPAWLGWSVAVVVGAPVAVRKRWPVAALAAVLAGFVVASAMGIALARGGWAFLLAPVLVLYSVGRERTGQWPHRLLPAIVLTGGVAIAVLLALPGLPPFETLVVTGLLTLELSLAWLVGRAVRQWRAQAALADRRRTERAVADERLRIARELHDVVAHSLSLIAVKAGAANHVAESRPDEAREALRVIEDASRATLNEMRRLLGVLRLGDEPELGDDRTPAPGLAGLANLAERARKAGVRVTLLESPVAGVPPGVQLSAYRIVQEALTNVVKHAPGARAVVAVDAADGVLRIGVADDGPGPRPGWQRGHGLIGMRERVAVYDGTFHAEPGPDGGFTVTARLPYR